MQLNLRNITSGHIIVSTISVLIFFVAITGLWGMLITKEGPLGEDKVVTIPRGASVGQIAQVLTKESVIGGEFIFKLSSKMMFSTKLLQAGTYKFEQKMSLRDVIKKVERGDVVAYKFTVPEGLTTAEVISKLEKAPHLVGEIEEQVGEGLLLPETYSYTHGEKRSVVLKRMEKAMVKALDKAWENRAEGLPLASKSDLLILASMVEKEAANDEERPEIAGVFINRLNKKMRLQSDPTVIYGASDYNGDITRRHLKEKHSYNTYVIDGLPVGPIANPGRKSLEAVANPNQTNNLFFVANAQMNGHVFAESLKQHKLNVKAYLKAYKEKYE